MHNVHKSAMSILKKYRTESGMTQKQLAKLIGISQGSLSRIETGETRPEWVTAARIAKVTNGAVPVDAWAPSKGAA